MKPRSIARFISAALTIGFMLACSRPVLSPAAPAAGLPTLPLIPTVTAVSTSVALSQQVLLVSVPFDETSDTPPYRLSASTPQLAGSDDPRVQAFNQHFARLITSEIDAFRQGILQNTVPPVSGAGSFLDVSSTLVSQIGDTWSFRVEFSFYSDGAAHPGLYSISVNYYLAQGRELILSELFVPNSNYLERISNYCIADLGKRDIAFEMFSQGATPTAENYRNWNIAPEGLMITFDNYQVAPYAAGPQTVIVPYSELQAIINTDGPLGEFIR